MAGVRISWRAEVIMGNVCQREGGEPRRDHGHQKSKTLPTDVSIPRICAHGLNAARRADWLRVLANATDFAAEWNP
jgi:hypothetical protein